MKTKTIELYEFDELSKAVKAKVLERERYINVDDDFWHKYQLEEWEGKLEELGFDDPKISYSGFGSQGDGASFTCPHVDIEKFLTAQKKRSEFKALLKAMRDGKIEVNASVISIDHHYSHEYTVRAELEVLPDEDGYTNFFNDGNVLENIITETVRALSHKIYKELETEYFYLTSDEQVIETIKANEYTFTASGRMENL